MRNLLDSLMARLGYVPSYHKEVGAVLYNDCYEALQEALRDLRDANEASDYWTGELTETSRQWTKTSEELEALREDMIDAEEYIDGLEEELETADDYIDELEEELEGAEEEIEHLEDRNLRAAVEIWHLRRLVEFFAPGFSWEWK